MKTIQNIKTLTIKRVSDTSSRLAIGMGEWKYVQKSLWKEQIRDMNKTPIQANDRVKSNEMSKAKKRHLRRKK